MKTNLNKTTNDVQNMSVFKLGWPIFIQALLSMCLGYADTLMISKYDDTAVGGLGNANQIIGFLTLAFSIISSATGVIVAQYLGAKRKDRLSQIYTVSISFNLILSLLISGILFLFTNQIIALIHVPTVMVPYARSYMSIVGGFLFLQALIDTFSQIFRNNGQTKIGMFVSIGMNIINITGNFLFLYGPLKFLQLGVKGVAISTTASRFLAVIIGIIYFAKKIEGTFSFRLLRPFPWDILKQLLTLGLPTAGENISYNFAQILILTMVNSFNSKAVTNTKTYASILSNFAYLYSISAAMATAIIVGHLVGEKNYDTSYTRVLKTLRTSMIISVSIAAFSYLISPFTFKLFTNDSEVIALGQTIMLICIFLEIGRTANLVIINSMRAAGDVAFPTILGMASMWGVSVVFGFILGIVFNLGLPGIWIAMAMDEILRGVIVYIRWRRGGWRNKRVVAD